MSIEQKIAELLAESRAKELAEDVKLAGKEGGQNSAKGSAAAGDQSIITNPTSVKPAGETANPDNAKNNVQDEDEAADATEKKNNPANSSAASGDQKPVSVGPTSMKAGMKEDMDALFNGEELSEEFKGKATTIFEAAVMARVNAEVARIEEEFNAKLEESQAQNQEGLVEKVDGYLDYVVEQWIAQNEIALERGMKSEILEGFVAGLKGLFEEHYIDIPEEKFDVLGSLEEQVEELEAKLNEQVAANVELNKVIAESKRDEIISQISEGLSDTEAEKFKGLAEELSYEDADTFTAKVKTIRENYFSTKALTEGLSSVVTDTPVLTEEAPKRVDPAMSAYLSALNRNK